MLLANNRQRIGLSFLTSLVMLFLAVSVAQSAPSYPTTWNSLYPSSSSESNASCQLCHAASTQNLNPYGKAFCDQAGTTTARIQAVETANSDADSTGSSNITEINASTQPGWTTTAVPTYARGNCTATGLTETAPAGVSGLLDPVVTPTTTTTLPPTTTTTLPPTTTTTLPPTTTTTLPPTTTTTLPPTTTTTLPPTTTTTLPPTTTTTLPPTTTTTLPSTTTTTTLPPEDLCGDGTVDPGEECDVGTSNGTTICGCQSDCTYTPADTSCDDGLFCNGNETCDGAGACQAGTPVVCDDGVGCTDDSCDEASDMCVYTPNDANCPDDGLFCTGTEFCDAVNDCSSTGDPCNDGVDCTVDVCDEVEDSCTNTPDDALCDDAELCTTDSCDEVAGCIFTPVECPEGQQCDSSDGQCQPLGCTDDAECDDGFFCNGAETCDTATGTCRSGTPVDCDDGVDCTVDTCDEFDDVCVNTPDDIACPDDGLFCTGDEICDPEVGCVSTGDPCPEWVTTCNEETDTCDMVTGKVTICHIPYGHSFRARTLRIDANAVAAHLRHEDFLGPCP